MGLAFETSVGVQSGDFGFMITGSDMAQLRGHIDHASFSRLSIG